MKTYIIQLEVHDDLASARDKIAWAKARRVIFIWPKTGRVLDEFVPLSLLKREADHHGIRISFITKDAEVRETARVLGIPVFNSVSEAERKIWRSNHPKKTERGVLVGYDRLVEQREELYPVPRKSQAKQAGRVILFMLSLAAVFGLLAFFYPSAQIKVFPRRDEQKVDLSVKVDPSATEVNLSGIIPGKLMKVELSGSRTGSSTGAIKVGMGKATGVLSVTNLSDKSVLVTKGIRFTPKTAKDQIFLSTADITLPPKSSSPVEIQVEAEEPGEGGNLPAGSEFTANMNWSADVLITNGETFTGGSTINSATPTEEDYNALRVQILNDMKNQAAGSISKQLPPGSLLIGQSLENSGVVSEIRSIEPGTPADHFTLEVRVHFNVTTFAQSDLAYLANSILDANLKKGAKALEGSLLLEDLSKATADSNLVYSWNIEASREVGDQLSKDTIAEQLIGKPVGEVQRIVANMIDLRAPCEVKTRPGWWKKMPFVSFRIEIEEQ